MLRFQLSNREKILSSIIGFLVVVCLFLFLFRPNDVVTEQVEEELFQVQEPEKEELQEVEPVLIVVDVKGAVHSPGVYEMQEGSRVIDAIEKAEGFLDKAAQEAVNLASRVSDEMLIYVPEEGEEDIVAGTPLRPAEEGKININSATSAELQTLNGVGPAKAEAILAYREENGKFETVEELLEVSGIGERSLEKLKDDIIAQ
ncbi:helix-hairpin-helix domain-containing protein [Bacillus tianshenii]|nr:helix-hairpin-helix domain-containing protein [Bacillus tianshenii]